MVPFSARLDWHASTHALADAEARLRAAGRPILDLTNSNPSAAGLCAPPGELTAALTGLDITVYQPAPLGLTSARAAVAAELARQGGAIDPARIALTVSSSESYSFLFKLLCNPGDAVCVPIPSYPLFDYLARLDGVTPRPYRLRFDGRWHIDFASLDLAGARAVVVVNPNNPTGSFVARDDLDRLATLCAAAGVALIADEVFADHALGAPADAVSTILAHRLPCLSFALGGLSKSCGLPQLKLGWIACAGPAATVDAALTRLELIADTYLSVGTPVQHALPHLFSLGVQLRSRIISRLRENRATLQIATAPPSPLTLLPIEGGWSAIVRVPAVLTEEALCLHLLEQRGLVVHPGYFFDLDLGATVVLSLLTEPTAFAAGVATLVSAVDALVA